MRKKSFKNDQGFYEYKFEDYMSMIFVPSGKFWLGDEDNWLNKSKMKEVYLEQYWIGKYLITNEQFEKFVDDTKYITDAEKIGSGWAFTQEEGWHWRKGANWRDPEGLGKGIENRMNYPVLQVSWYDASTYSQWLHSKIKNYGNLSLKVQLPTQYQWEKAARGVDQRLFPWGDEIPSPLRCNMEWIHSGHSAVDQYEEFGVSPYGVCDMAGNVWEWTLDGFTRGLYCENKGEEPIEMELHKLRGGSWDFSDAKDFSISAHLDVPSRHRYRTVSFRVVIVIDDKIKKNKKHEICAFLNVF